MCVLAGTDINGTSTITTSTQTTQRIKVTYPRPGTAAIEGCAFHDGADGFYMEDGVLYVTKDGVNVAAYREWITVEKIVQLPVFVPPPFVNPFPPFAPGDGVWPRPNPPYWVTNMGLIAICGHDVSECPCRVRSFDCSPDNNKTGS